MRLTMTWAPLAGLLLLGPLWISGAVNFVFGAWARACHIYGLVDLRGIACVSAAHVKSACVRLCRTYMLNLCQWADFVAPAVNVFGISYAGVSICSNGFGVSDSSVPNTSTDINLLGTRTPLSDGALNASARTLSSSLQCLAALDALCFAFVLVVSLASWACVIGKCSDVRSLVQEIVGDLHDLGVNLAKLSSDTGSMHVKHKNAVWNSELTALRHEVKIDKIQQLLTSLDKAQQELDKQFKALTNHAPWIHGTDLPAKRFSARQSTSPVPAQYYPSPSTWPPHSYATAAAASSTQSDGNLKLTANGAQVRDGPVVSDDSSAHSPTIIRTQDGEFNVSTNEGLKRWTETVQGRLGSSRSCSSRVSVLKPSTVEDKLRCDAPREPASMRTNHTASSIRTAENDLVKRDQGEQTSSSAKYRPQLNGRLDPPYPTLSDKNPSVSMEQVDNENDGTCTRISSPQNLQERLEEARQMGYRRVFIAGRGWMSLRRLEEECQVVGQQVSNQRDETRIQSRQVSGDVDAVGSTDTRDDLENLSSSATSPDVPVGLIPLDKRPLSERQQQQRAMEGSHSLEIF